ncbi:MAG: hypothetical protein K5685_06400 [Bacteroidales bacterium]|nr:hypothetical protein [Bacteroidales bacterium]
MKIIERIFEYIKYKGVTISDFERKNSLSNGYLRKMKQRSADIGETIIINILENCPDISLNWFVLGEGTMLKTETPLEDTSNDVLTPENGVLTPENGVLNTLMTPLLDRIDALTRENERLKIEVETLKNGSK